MNTLMCVFLMAVVRLAEPFSDGAVLQRERPVAVWGTAGVDETVCVSFAGQKKLAKVGEGRGIVLIANLSTRWSARG